MTYRFPLTGKWSAEHPYTLIDHINAEGKGEWAGLRFRDYRWNATRVAGGGNQERFYVSAQIVSGQKAGRAYAHQFLSGKRGIDHIDRDPFNNTSLNFREATNGQQVANRTIPRSNTSGLVGVYWCRRKRKWCAHTKVNGKHRHIGYFDDKHEAGKAYDKVVSEIWGEFAALNFPDEMRVAA